MTTLMYLEIPEFYHACSRDVYSGDSGTRKGKKRPTYVADVRYHCLKCGTNFKVEHKPVPMTYGFNDTFFQCPVCGQKFYNSVRTSDVAHLRPWKKGDAAPIEMRLRLTESKDTVTLHVWSKVIQMDAERGTYIHSQLERFRFDIRQRRATFYTTVSDENNFFIQAPMQVEMGGLLANDILDHSMLWHINSGNLVFKQHCFHKEPEFREQDARLRKEVNTLLRRLREAVQRKWKAHYGYKLNRLYVSPGTQQGLLLFPLLNIAWRLIYPDANNLPKYLGMSSHTAKIYLQRRLFREEDMAAYIDNPYARSRLSSAQAVIKQLQLPDTTFTRRALTKDLLSGPGLQQAFRITQNPGYARQLLHCLGWKEDAADGSFDYYVASWAFPVIQEATLYWPIQTILPSIRKLEGLRGLRDTLMMIHKLKGREVDIEPIRQLPVRRVHDWLVGKMCEVKEAGFALHVPEAVQRRLQMQLDNGYLRFFVPQHSHDLDRASLILHNCVKTYSDRVAKGECQIVLMTDDTGLMKACLEIRNNALVQAKLKFNRPVSEDAAVNSAIRDWCRDTGLTIRTQDVRQPHYLVPITERRAV